MRLLAAHLDIMLEVVPVSIFEGRAATPEFLAKTPMGTVPARSRRRRLSSGDECYPYISCGAYQREVGIRMDRAEERAGLEDVGQQALMRGLDTSISVCSSRAVPV